LGRENDKGVFNIKQEIMQTSANTRSSNIKENNPASASIKAIHPDIRMLNKI
jgi:hypothetical protein